MTKKIELATMGAKEKEKSALDAKFVGKENGAETSEFPPVSFFRLYRYATGLDKLLLIIGLLASVGTAAVQPLNMLIFGDLTQDLIVFVQILANASISSEEKEEAAEMFKENIASFSINNSLIGLATLVFSYLSASTFNYSAIRQSFKIRSIYLEKVLNQDISWYDKHQSGDFASRMADDLLKLEDGIGEKVSMFAHCMISFLALLIMALIRGWELALICLISLPVTMIALGVVAYLTTKLAKKEVDAYGSAGTIATEVLSNIKTVLAFGGQHKELDRYSKELVFAKDNNIKRSLLSGVGFGILWFCIYSSYALAFWYGVGLILRGDTAYEPGNMVTVFFSIMSASMNFGMASPYIEVFGIAKGAASTIFGVIDHEPVINLSKGKGKKLDRIVGNIRFSNIFFNYPSRPDVKILNGLNLTIKSGETVALVGSSGCGKSTCIQLMQRFYDPDKGDVYLDDTNLKDMDLTWLRNNIGVVGQEPVLFGTTILENIRYGFKEATLEDIERAAKKANAHKFIMTLPQGYNTMVGERGAQLSGGQKQRIAIARALVREPAILLLDEATSALDTNSEAKVQSALDNASKECTTIIVAHRLSTIRGASRIVVIKEGVVVEEGTHQELMELKKEYHNLVTMQVSTADENENDDKRVSLMKDEDDGIQVSNEYSEEVINDDYSTTNVSVWKILAMNSPEKLNLIVGVIASAIMGCAMPVFAILFGDIIGVLQNNDDDVIRSQTDEYCIYFVLAGVVAGFATYLQIHMFGIAGEKLVMRVRTQMFGAMLKQEIGWYDRKDNGIGALCAKLSNEAANIQGATGQRIGTIVQSMATLLLSVGISMYYEWKLGLVALAFTPIIMAAIFLQQRLVSVENDGYRKSLQASTKLAVEAVGNIRTVSSLGCENTFHSAYIKELLPFTVKAKRNIHFRAVVIGLGRSIMFFAYAACMYYGGHLVLYENLAFERVLKVSQALIMGTVSIANALAFTPNFQKGIDAAHNLLKLINRIPKVADATGASEKPWKEGKIEYSNVFFNYPTRPDTRVLQGLDLSIFNGQTVALVGPSGCGKSTIIQLIERYYDPLEGHVTVDEDDLREVRMESLRSNLGIVSQEPNLFDRTIAQNIAYGDNSREVTTTEIIEAAKNANIHNFIATLPLGYDTPLGDKGTQLSGGQKQRVAIARALVRNPKVLLLDEATSALDTESEKVVQDALDAAKQGRTCITIAHRLTTIQDADVICVINEGRVYEMGKHSELLAEKGLYYKLHKLQSRKN